jgi:hypothetical protein
MESKIVDYHRNQEVQDVFFSEPLLIGLRCAVLCHQLLVLDKHFGNVKRKRGSSCLGSQ